MGAWKVVILINVSSFLMPPYSRSFSPFNDDSNPISGSGGLGTEDNDKPSNKGIQKHRKVITMNHGM